MSTREKQFKSIQAKAEELAAEVAALADEIEEGLDNLPENFQGTETAEANQSRLDELRDFEEDLQVLIDYDWSNP